MTSAKRTQVEIAKIHLSPETQQRVLFSDAWVADMVEDLENGEELPPVVLFSTGHNDYWCGDGHYRIAAHKALERPHIYADVHPGGLRDAIVYSCGVNGKHGCKRTPDDITKAIKVLLSDGEWGRWSESKIASVCKVSKARVQRIKSELLEPPEQEPDEAGERSTPILFSIEDDRQKARLGEFAELLTAARVIASEERWEKAEKQVEKWLDGCAAALEASV